MKKVIENKDIYVNSVVMFGKLELKKTI